MGDVGGDAFVIDRKRQASLPEKRRRSAAQAVSRERELERLVFGDDAGLDPNFGRENDGRDGDESSGDSSIEGGEDGQQDGTPAGRPGGASTLRRTGRAAWNDDDDDELAVDVSAAARTRKLRRAVDETVVRGRDYEQRLRERFAQTYGNVAWARRRAPGKQSASSFDRAGRVGADGGSDGSEEEAGEEAGDNDGGSDLDAEEAIGEALRSTKPLVQKSGLSPTELRVSRVLDANAAERSSAAVQAIGFHPTSSLFLTAGLDRTLRLFRIDGAENPKVQGVFFKDLPLTCAAFHADGQQVVVCGRGRHLFALDLPTSTVVRVPPLKPHDGGLGGGGAKAYDQMALSPDGEWLALSAANSGTVLLLAARSKQLVGTLRMNRPGSALTFSGGGAGGGASLLLSGSKAGEVYMWDVRSSRCACRFRDDGLSDTTALAADLAGRSIAVGSASGIVNVYNRDTLLAGDSTGPGSASFAASARPLKALQNLTTVTTSLSFSHDGRLLALASRTKRNALRIAHVPTLGVYPNWPTAKTPLRHAQCVAFHPRGAYFASGNDRGHVLLYRLEAYAADV